MNTIRELILCFVGPKLYRIRKYGDQHGMDYQASNLETMADSLIGFIKFSLSLCPYISPFFIHYLYTKEHVKISPNPHLSETLIATASRIGSTIFLVLISSFGLLGLCRFKNKEYFKFITSYSRALCSEETVRKDFLSKYDFHMNGWPADYRWDQSKLSYDPPKLFKEKKRNLITFFDYIRYSFWQIISYIAVHTLGKRLIFPGSVGIVQKLLSKSLIDGRRDLIEHANGQRCKLLSYCNDEIDTIFIDARGENSLGKKLVICCEGNSGFYEIGILATPRRTGYSVLGWNHPGFGQSTGVPFPEEEVCAIDIVIRYAVEKLKFNLEDIILMGWSIGGFAASWGAAKFPSIGGVILDATFDDVKPLMVTKIPSSWKYLVLNMSEIYFDLDVSYNLRRYNGPILIIRRTKDEIIHTRIEDPIRTNRANDLLINLLTHRFPNLMDDNESYWVLKDWLSGADLHHVLVYREHKVDEEECLNLLKNYISEHGKNYPLMIGSDLSSEKRVQLVLYLASKHFVDYDSTHCTPLPRDFMRDPWNLFAINNDIKNQL